MLRPSIFAFAVFASLAALPSADAQDRPLIDVWDEERPIQSRDAILRSLDRQIDEVAERLDAPLPRPIRRRYLLGGAFLAAFVPVAVVGVRSAARIEGPEDDTHWSTRRRRTGLTTLALGAALLSAGLAFLLRAKRMQNDHEAEDVAEYRRLRLERRAAQQRR